MVIEVGNAVKMAISSLFFFFFFFLLKMHVSPTVYSNIWTTTSEFNDQSFLQSMQLIILYNNL